MESLIRAHQPIHLKPLEETPKALADLQRVFEASSGYFIRLTGYPASGGEAQSALTALPPGMGYGDKFIFGVYANDERVGVADLIRGYPDRKTAMLGLLLLSEKVHGRGIGKAAYQAIETLISRWAGVETVRIGIVSTNDQVIPFWEKMGFKDTGVRKPYHHDKVDGDTVVFEKKIVSTKSRYSMRAKLNPVEVQSRWAPQPLSQGSGEALGVLMERAYRGTVDDEGETRGQFVAEAKETLEGKWGAFVPEASFGIAQDGRTVSATVVTLWKDKPLLAYSVTEPAYQGQGMASCLIRQTMNALQRLGYTELDLGVTAGNAAAENLYRKLGFQVNP